MRYNENKKDNNIKVVIIWKSYSIGGLKWI
jgi:hypothetical protein